jgi:diacylglycerol kinase family enzyme
VNVVAIANPVKLDDIRAAERNLNSLAAELGQAPPTWVLTTQQDTGAGQAKRAVADGAELILVWGGDGTVTSVAEGLAGSDVPLGLLPGGTGNLLARNLDIPLELSAALKVAYEGRDRRIDLLNVSLGKGERRVSTVMCGMGWDASMMNVSEKAKARLGWGAYAIKAARTVRDHPLRMRVRVDDGEEHQFLGRLCLVANVGTLVGGIALLPESKPDDGLLEVLVFDPTTLADYARTSYGVLRGRPNAEDPVRTLLRGKKVVVTTHKSRPRQIDGDLVTDGYGFVVRVMQGALTVRCP